jgi:NhaP-type Na+/H+ or K+/H+ antiporter
MPLFEAPAPHLLWLIGAGALILLVAWLPLLLKERPLSLPIICVGIGWALFQWVPMPIVPLPQQNGTFTERIAEFVVIVALMGAGLKIDTEFHLRRWALTWRLLAITMPLSIAGIAALGWWAGLPLAAALLLGAALAPTDPVLASDIQVGPPRTGEEDEVRFALTSEAGLNDGLAFPFVNLALALVVAVAGEPWLRDWALIDVGWKLAAGVGAGWAIGWGLGWLTFRMPGSSALAQTGDGLVAIAATLLSYALTEAIHGYGFLAVFVTALTLRHAHRTHEFHRDMHDIVEQVERLAMMVLLILFGGALAAGLLAPLRPIDWAVALISLLVVRPLAGFAGLAGALLHGAERWTIAFFGIRGVGTIYYLAYALNRGNFGNEDRLWAITGVVILLSILLHGLTVTPVMQRLDRRAADQL